MNAYCPAAPADQLPVAPTKPLAPYIGGKRVLAKLVCAAIAATPHQIYAEAFVGMGGIFFRRTQRPTCEVINDWSREVSNLFRVIQVHYVAFVGLMQHQITARAEFERLAGTAPDTLTDMQRAARFLYLQRTSFGGKVTGQDFGVSPGTGARFNITKLEPMIADVHERLAGVTIERLPWEKFLARWDRPGTLFYLDPPYFGNEGDYGKELFSRDQFEVMAEVLSGLKGRFILSINDHPDVRRIFGRFDLNAVDCTYSLGSKPKAVKELIITPA